MTRTEIEEYLLFKKLRWKEKKRQWHAAVACFGRNTVQ